MMLSWIVANAVPLLRTPIEQAVADGAKARMVGWTALGLLLLPVAFVIRPRATLAGISAGRQAAVIGERKRKLASHNDDLYPLW